MPMQPPRKRSFKSCPRVGGIVLWQAHPQAQGEFQVVPPCGGHQKLISRLQICVAVSSRAPVWGASYVIPLSPITKKVSSRAPVWGASPLPIAQR